MGKCDVGRHDVGKYNVWATTSLTVLGVSAALKAGVWKGLKLTKLQQRLRLMAWKLLSIPEIGPHPTHVAHPSVSISLTHLNWQRKRQL